jgi:hypothetical protein
MKRYLIVSFAIVALAIYAQGFAHHSFAATYLETESATIEGQLVQFQLRNPHAYVHVVVKEPDGSTTRWVVEWGSPTQLSGTGVTQNTLKPGDHVIISGNPGRDPANHRLRLLTLRRPKDGLSWGLLPNEKFDR